MSVKDSVKSQYHASLDMLQQAVEKCPDTLWDDRAYKNVFWHIAYHILYFTHLYLQPSLKEFTPWTRHIREYRILGDMPAGKPYTKEEILEYLGICRQQVEEKVASMNLDAPSGFSWLPPDKLEQQMYSLRHMQQHIGELGERLGAKGDVDISWAFASKWPAG
jgi:hypothetical protein